MLEIHEYATTDIALGAFLISEYRANLVNAIRQSNRVTFYFQSPKDLEKAVRDFFSGKDKVSAIAFTRAQDLLRDAIRRANSQKERS